MRQKAKQFTVFCQSNGCMWMKLHLTRKEADREAVSHINMYQHNPATTVFSEVEERKEQP